MRAVQKALMRAPGLSSEQLVARLDEWQRLVLETARGVFQGSELATIYEIIGVLNSSLDLAETLELVMDSLIHLTGAERGCLMLLDEEGNLEIRAAQSFDQQSVAPSDLELSHTVVRDAVEGAQPVLTTNAQHDPRFSTQDSVIGYQLRSVVCVPLRVRGRVIGALYLDNRIREGVFSEADLPMLAAFASQAAIAIENARLYTMTDQALAARLEELTTLQQIDQELNASLDYGRVLELTLSWALRATGAGRGTLSMLDEDGRCRTVSHLGEESPRGPEPDAVRLVMASREPIVIGAKRMLVPIRCKDRVVGLLDLRGNGGRSFRPDHAQFASRVADHAAIAIENARLYERVRQANLAKSEFVSLVAHELRTPMTSIRGYTDMLARQIVGPLTPRQAEFLSIIGSNVHRMQVLVSDLQDISRIETGRLRLEMESTALAEAIQNALQATRGQIEGRSQQLELDVPEGLPRVHADPARLAQILINLLSNAHKYTPEGGRIRVRAWLDNGYVHCSVIDNGVGISVEDQTQLFTKFFRSENPAVRQIPGTGLGLCIVKSLVELQGGRIELASALGEGSTFTFTVPVSEPA
jgi:signal transduction histidine kinase